MFICWYLFQYFCDYYQILFNKSKELNAIFTGIPEPSSIYDYARYKKDKEHYCKYLQYVELKNIMVSQLLNIG